MKSFLRTFYLYFTNLLEFPLFSLNPLVVQLDSFGRFWWRLRLVLLLPRFQFGGPYFNLIDSILGPLLMNEVGSDSYIVACVRIVTRGQHVMTQVFRNNSNKSGRVVCVVKSHLFSFQSNKLQGTDIKHQHGTLYFTSHVIVHYCSDIGIRGWRLFLFGAFTLM